MCNFMSKKEKSAIRPLERNGIDERKTRKRWMCYVDLCRCGCHHRHRLCGARCCFFTIIYSMRMIRKTGGYKTTYMLPPSNQWIRFTYIHRAAMIACNTDRHIKCSTVFRPVWSVVIIQCVLFHCNCLLSRKFVCGLHIFFPLFCLEFC